jgi:hypothetical protein
MAQAASLRPVTTETRIRARISPCGTWGGHSGSRRPKSRKDFSPSQYPSTVDLHTHISSVGLKIGPLVSAVQRHSLKPWS